MIARLGLSIPWSIFGRRNRNGWAGNIRQALPTKASSSDERKHRKGITMSSGLVPRSLSTATLPTPAREELPLTVRDAATYLGVSPQTVYLWVERKQIPHLRVMGRNIRFLRSELEPFRATFKQEVVEWQDQ